VYFNPIDKTLNILTTMEVRYISLIRIMFLVYFILFIVLYDFNDYVQLIASFLEV